MNPQLPSTTRVGAQILTEWRIMRIADEPLAALAATTPYPPNPVS